MCHPGTGAKACSTGISTNNTGDDETKVPTASASSLRATASTTASSYTTSSFCIGVMRLNTISECAKSRDSS